MLTSQQAKPILYRTPVDQTVYEGQTATFRCAARGRGVRYQWQKADSGDAWSNVSGATSAKYTTGTLTRTSDSGDRYRCIVSNSAGRVVAGPVTLTVWNPIDLGSDLACWLDPSQGVFTERTGSSATTPSTTGNPVGTWRARNGTINCTATTDASRPNYRSTGMNGYPALQFDATDDFLSCPDLLAVTQNKPYVYIFLGAKITSATSERIPIFFGNNVGSTRTALFFNQGGTSGTMTAGGRRLDANSFASASLASAHVTIETVVMGGEFLYSSSDLHLRKNGARVASNTAFQTDGSTSNTASANASIGANGTGTAGYMSGDISDIVIVTPSAELSSDNITHIENFIAARCNMPLFDWNLKSRAVGATAATMENKGIVCQPNGDTPTEGAPASHRYRHANAITQKWGRLHVMYASAGVNEDCGGQQVCYCYSDDKGATWSSPVTLLTSQSNYDNANDAFPSGAYVGLVRRWVISGDRLFATFGVDEYNGIGTGWLGAEGVMLAAREVLSNGSLGTLVRISAADYTALDSKTKLNYDSAIANLIYAEADVFGIWGGTNPGNSPSQAWSGWLADSTQEYAELVTAYDSDIDTDILIRTCRDVTNSNANVYQSQSIDAGVTWETPSRTNWPSSPQVTYILRLRDGRLAILGNTDASRTELYLAIADATTLKCSDVVQIEYNTDTTPVYAGTYKNGGPSYPSAVQWGNYLYVAWSLQKEQIWAARVLIPGLSDNDNDG